MAHMKTPSHDRLAEPPEEGQSPLTLEQLADLLDEAEASGECDGDPFAEIFAEFGLDREGNTLPGAAAR
jgi:hypothetical protein